MEKTGITICDKELTEEEAQFFAVAHRVMSKGEPCKAAGDFCAYCPIKKCSYEEAIEYMKEYL